MSDIAVIGSGFSGISVVYWLHQLGVKATLISLDIPEKASAVPLGLMSPAGGQKGIPIWRYKDGLRSTFDLLDELQNFNSETKLYKKSPVLRPAMQPFIEEYFRKNFDSFPEDDVKWLSADEIHDYNPHVFNQYGGMLIHAGAIISGDAICTTIKQYADHYHIPMIHNRVYRIEQDGDGFRLYFDNFETKFDKIIIATGSVLPAISGIDVSNLIVPVKGQLMKLRKNTSDAVFDHAISGQGYIAELNGEAAFGSTYEHDFTTLEPTQTAENKLRDQLSVLFPNWEKYYSVSEQWTGVRASTPDRMPMLGNFEVNPNLYFYFGNGSKGMIWSSLLGKLLARLIVKNEELPKEVAIQRFAKRVVFG